MQVYSPKVRCSLGLVLAIVPLAIGGCGLSTADEMEVIDSQEQAWAVIACGRTTTAANATFNNFVDPAHVSPQSYNTCHKSYVVDVNSLSAAYVGPGAGGGPDAHISVQWADTVPNTQAACENLWGGAIFYEWSGSAWTPLTGQLHNNGVWFNPPGLAWCIPPGQMSLGHFTLQAGKTYRVAASMRLASTDVTRKVSVRTVPRTIIH